jgi:FtsP/CotA-like multicopper oxidase with cupredoxin domain
MSSPHDGLPAGLDSHRPRPLIRAIEASEQLTRRQLLIGIGASGALVAAGGLAGCTRSPSTSSGRPTSGSGAASPDFAEPPVRSSENGRLEVDLRAAAATVPYAGTTRWSLAYNGSTPGPTLRVRPGDELTITLDNALDGPTNLHTHGLHVSPEGDSDNVFVMVEPGETHTYRYRIPADHRSGTFWYHPHHHGQLAEQVSGGLAGAIVIEDAIDELPELAAATSRVLVLADPNIGDSPAVLRGSMMDTMSGREGDAVVVNGLLRPRMKAATGTLEHWRLVNASPSRYYALSLDGLQMHLVASDAGRLDRPRSIDSLVLVPGERVEVLIAIDEPGTHRLVTRSVDRGGMGMMGGGMGRGPGADGATAEIAVLEVTGDTTASPALPSVLADVRTPPDAEVTRTRTVTLAMGMGMGMGGREGQFTIDGRSFDPNRIDITSQLDTTEDWIVRNTSPMDHPFHLHVWPFQVISTSDGIAPPQGWKDTVNVPAGGSVTIRVPFRDFAGKTVYHCHILDHEDLGMMGIIETRP